MSTGMIWFNNKDNVNEIHNALLQALDDYQRWYGIPPRKCQANPTDLGSIQKFSRKLRLQMNSNHHLEPGQFWLGN